MSCVRQSAKRTILFQGVGALLATLWMAGFTNAPHAADATAPAVSSESIYLQPAISSDLVRDGDRIHISAIANADAGIASVKAMIRDRDGAAVADLDLTPPESEFDPEQAPFMRALWLNTWTAGGITDGQEYSVLITVTDLEGTAKQSDALNFQGGKPKSAAPEPAVGINSLAFLGSAVAPDNTDGAYYAMVMDKANGHIYVGTDYSGDGPARVIKFNMGTGDNPPTRVGHITLEAGENDLRAGVIDTVNGFAYFGTHTFPGGKIVKIRLSDFTRVGVLPLDTGEDGLFCAHIDPVAGYAWFGTDTSPGRIIKIRLSDFTRLGALTLDAGENQLRCNVIVDPINNYGYFGTFTSPGQVVRVDLGTGNNLPTRIDDLTLDDDVSFLRSAEIILETHEAFFGTFQFPAEIAKIDLGTGEVGPILAGGPGSMKKKGKKKSSRSAAKALRRSAASSPPSRMAVGEDQLIGFYETDPGSYGFFGGLAQGEEPTILEHYSTNDMKYFYSLVKDDASPHLYVTSFTDGELGKFKAEFTPLIQSAALVSGTIPAQLAAGYTHPTTVTMSNTGQTTWTVPGNYSLAVVSDSCNLLSGASRIPMPNSPTVNPGQSVTFNLDLKAPGANGPCTLQLRMIQELIEFFGDTVTVNPNVVTPVKNSQFMSNTIPATMAPSQGYYFSIIVRNLGNMVWRPGGRFILDATSDSCGLFQTAVAVAENVNPNQNHTFTAFFTPPASPQSCHLELRMHENTGVAAVKDPQLFGDPPVPFGATLVLDINIVVQPNTARSWAIYQ